MQLCACVIRKVHSRGHLARVNKTVLRFSAQRFCVLYYSNYLEEFFLKSRNPGMTVTSNERTSKIKTDNIRSLTLKHCYIKNCNIIRLKMEIKNIEKNLTFGCLFGSCREPYIETFKNKTKIMKNLNTNWNWKWSIVFSPTGLGSEIVRLGRSSITVQMTPKD